MDELNNPSVANEYIAAAILKINRIFIVSGSSCEPPWSAATDVLLLSSPSRGEASFDPDGCAIFCCKCKRVANTVFGRSRCVSDHSVISRSCTLTQQVFKSGRSLGLDG